MAQEVRHVWSVDLEQRYDSHNHFHVYYTAENGLSYVHGFPEPLTAHIAAAYSVDPAAADASDQVLDIILHQHHIPEPTDPANWATDVAAKAGMTKKIMNAKVVTPGTVVPTTLYTAETDEEAKAAHLLRIKEVKKNVLYVPYTEVDVKTLKQSAAQLFHTIRDVEGGTPVNPMDDFRRLFSVAPEELVPHQNYIGATRLWVHGKKPNPAFRTLERLGPETIEQRNKRPKNPAITRQRTGLTLTPVQE